MARAVSGCKHGTAVLPEDLVCFDIAGDTVFRRIFGGWAISTCAQTTSQLLVKVHCFCSIHVNQKLTSMCRFQNGSGKVKVIELNGTKHTTGTLEGGYVNRPNNR